MVEVVNPEASQSLAQRNLESIIRGFARFGVDPDELLREHAARTVGHPFGTPESFLRWNDLYVERLPPLSALFVGADTPFGQWEVVDFLAACYPTVGQSFRQVARHFVLINPHLALRRGPHRHHPARADLGVDAQVRVGAGRQTLEHAAAEALVARGRGRRLRRSRERGASRGRRWRWRRAAGERGGQQDEREDPRPGEKYGHLRKLLAAARGDLDRGRQTPG